MLYVVSLVLLLVVLAGVIAYAGDVLGTVVGKRRLSLFGWRPKRTGQVVGVAAGILIMLVTLSTLAVAFRGAAGVLLRAQRDLAGTGRPPQRAACPAERRRDLARQPSRPRRRSWRARDAALIASRAELEEAEASRDEALEAAINLYETTEELNEEIVALQAQAESLRERNSVLEADNTALAEQNNRLEGDAALLSGRNEELTGNMTALNDQVRGPRGPGGGAPGAGRDPGTACERGAAGGHGRCRARLPARRDRL